MNNQRLLWFQDGVKLNTSLDVWGTIDMLTDTLISLTGSSEFDHVRIDPFEAGKRLFEQIDFKNYTSIIDLSGFFGKSMASNIPDVSCVTNFRLSRLRNISSPKLDGTGFLVSLKREDIKKITKDFNLKRPLFIDDVSWSGRTILEAINLLGIEPENSTVGLLAINSGNFTENKLGARGILQKKGIEVLTGSNVHTPTDDGFHLSDFFTFDTIRDAFDVVLEIQKIREEVTGATSDTVKEGEASIRNIISANREILFPRSISTRELKELEWDGRFISLGGIANNSFFDTNPPNWFMPSFSKRVKWGTLSRNKEGIISVLEELKRTTTEGHILKEKESGSFGSESHATRGKEGMY